MTARDPRVWVPLLAALAMWLPRALPEPPAAAVARPRPLVLPALQAAAPTTALRHFELVAERSAVHFLAAGRRGESLVACPGVAAALDLDERAGSATLALELDLAALPAASGGLDLYEVLGVHRAARLTYTGTLVAREHTDLPGLQRLTFRGPLAFAGRIVQQPMQLWLCTLAGQPLRLQGQGTVAGSAYGLPLRHWLGVVPAHHEVTLGLDLAFRRQRDH